MIGFPQCMWFTWIRTPKISKMFNILFSELQDICHKNKVLAECINKTKNISYKFYKIKKENNLYRLVCEKNNFMISSKFLSFERWQLYIINIIIFLELKNEILNGSQCLFEITPAISDSHDSFLNLDSATSLTSVSYIYFN